MGPTIKNIRFKQSPMYACILYKFLVVSELAM